MNSIVLNNGIILLKTPGDAVVLNVTVKTSTARVLDSPLCRSV